MRRHLRWIVPLVLAPILYVGALIVYGAFGPTQPSDPMAVLGSALIPLAGVVSAIVLLIVALVQGTRTYRRWRRRGGHFTPAEQRELADQAETARLWEHARALRGHLIARRVPQQIGQWHVVPQPGEVFFEQLPLTYARYYGQDVTYQQSGGFFFGRPAFVVGALAVTAIANGVSRSNARAQAAPQWREWQQATVLISNQRLIGYANGQWLSFWFGGMTAVYPEVSTHTLICQFEQGEPLLLSGPAAPIAAVHTVLQAYGPDALAQHPSLRPLDVPAPAPTLRELGRQRRNP